MPLAKRSAMLTAVLDACVLYPPLRCALAKITKRHLPLKHQSPPREGFGDNLFRPMDSRSIPEIAFS